MRKWFLEIPEELNLFQIRNIDCIYLINLDRRPERLKRCLDQLALYQIVPQRVPGIDGWSLPQEVFNDIALLIRPNMEYDEVIQYQFGIAGDRIKPFNPDALGVRCLHGGAPAGGMGGALTHLSILNAARRAGQETIWVLEDDFTVDGNPHELADYIDRLDGAVGKGNWDILYTDDDAYFTPETVCAHVGSKRWLRPSIPITQESVRREAVGDDFFRIGGRTQAHSLIFRSSGIRKILAFLEENGFFLPFDSELACIPGLRLYNLKRSLIHGRDRTSSDTFMRLR